jgi:hypothetical protein
LRPSFVGRWSTGHNVVCGAFVVEVVYVICFSCTL